jgi:glycosyltransferase involved in cell wall biosynthesis
LAHGFGAQGWNSKYRKGQIIGINCPFPYGYYMAADHDCRVKHSEDKVESKIEKLLRLSVRYFLKFDFIHAWRNRKGISDADVVWTHTESQHLAILLLFWLMRPTHKPKLIAQSVWLFDRWSKFPRIHRWLFKRLLSQADILTVHSPENLKIASRLFPGVRCELVLYGINAEEIIEPQLHRPHDPIRLLSVGNDENRDWTTLIDAVKKLADSELRIVSHKVSPKLIAGASDISIIKLESNSELLELYEWADVLVLVLESNFHASGITVLQEAVLRGVPVVCSDAGGLKAYFPEDAIKYVRPDDAEAIRHAILEICKDDEWRWASIKRAQARMGPGGVNAQSYVKRHVELSRKLLFGI